MNKKSLARKGFTIIELIVVIAIIAVLAGVVMTNVQKYIGKAKVTRAVTDVANIAKALEVFKATYGGYPTGNYCPEPPCIFQWRTTAYYDGPGDPWLKTDSCNGSSDCPHLSEFYKSDWVGYNGDYFRKDAFYSIDLFVDNDGTVGCGAVNLQDSSTIMGWKFFLRQGCPNAQDSQGDYGTPFKLNP
jgi:prepilin-type N-terminal cleavage/methylation domain-containing protein